MITNGPTRSGRAAASIIVAQPPWQFPIMATFGLSGCLWRTVDTKRT